MTTRHECRFEQDVLDAVRTGRWPMKCEAALVAHVDECAVCADVAVVASVFSRELDDDSSDAAAGSPVPALPPAGLVWWRAQRRAREEALRKATWPVRLAQGVACVSVLVAAAILAGPMSGWIVGWVDSLAASPDLPRLSFSVPDLASLSPAMRTAVGLLLVAALALAPAAIYLSVADE